MNQHMRKHLCAPALLAEVRRRFSYHKDPLDGQTKYLLTDCLMSALAIFGLKYPSMLQFDKASRNAERTIHNLKALYGVEHAPCDTYMRERLDQVEPWRVESSFKTVLSQIQRSHLLELYRFMDGYLVPVDGTGVFYSDKVHCQHCCQRHHRDGHISYYHQLLCATIVHPNMKAVLPIGCESIKQQDGHTKNDCELNAVKRLFDKVAHQHPKLPIIWVGDALYANWPHLRYLRSHGWRHITVVKPANHQFLFDWVKASKRQVLTLQQEKKAHRFEWVCGAPICDACDDVKVNFLEYWETDRKGKIHHWTWITDLPLNEKTVEQVMRGGRARWRIENQAFNTLKNQGYHFEHNFGHGYLHLMDVLARLMLLAFLIDQAQLLACPIFKKALAKMGRPLYFWDRMRSLFMLMKINNWEMLYGIMTDETRLHFYYDTG